MVESMNGKVPIWKYQDYGAWFKEISLYLNRADALASSAPPISEALGGLGRGSIVDVVESAI